MGFVISEACVHDDKRDSFVVEVSLMHGDADYFDNRIIGPFARGSESMMTLLEDLVSTLEAMLSFSSPQENDYLSIPGYVRWFGRDGYEEYDDDAFRFLDDDSKDSILDWFSSLDDDEKSLCDNSWAYDPHSWDIPAGLDEYTVKYFDSDCVERAVEIV